jgi:hypothetical protein
VLPFALVGGSLGGFFLVHIAFGLPSMLAPLVRYHAGWAPPP